MSIAKNIKWLALVLILNHKTLAVTDFTNSININYSRFNLNSISVGFNRTDISRCLDHPLLSSWGYSISADMNFLNGLKSFGPKATIHISQSFFFEERLNLAVYNEFRAKKVWGLISPEIGLTYYGLISIFYGHNYYLDRSIKSKYSSRKFTLSLNPPFLIF
jgi:hypothetical protein